MKNKGFTLVELLVTIVILGIITGISIPIIRNVQANMVEKKYTTYLDSMKSSAKLYNDSYSEDMFGHNKAGVYCISYEQLESKKLIKDISIDDVTCASKKKTFVRVTKLDDKYVYAPFLECVSKTNANNVQKVLPNGSSVTIEDGFCSQSNNSPILLELDANYEKYKGSTYDKKRRKAKIVITSATGIYSSMNVSYAWYNIEESNSDLNWTTLKLPVPNAETQKKKLLNGENTEIVTASDEIITPNGGDGPYKLLIKAENLKDLYGNSYVGDNPKSFELYAIDGKEPAIEGFNIRSTSNLYKSKNVKIDFTGTDNHTASNDLKMCITTSDTGCKNKSDFKDKHKNGTSVDFKVSETQDGKERTIHVYLMDMAGNIKEVSQPYTVDKQYVVTLNNNGATKAGDSTATVIYNDNKLSKITNPEKVVKIKYVNNVGATISGGDTSKSYTLNGWYTAASDGSKVASNSTTPALQANVSGYTNASSQWTKTSGATLYAQWNPTTATLPRVTKGGYNCKWTTDNGASSVQSGGTWTFSSANERTFTAVCTAKTVKVTFKKNSSSASGTDNQTQTFTYGKSGQKFSPKGFSWTGHTQGKWAESATGAGVYSIESGVSDDWINSHSPSITLYATWTLSSYTVTLNNNGATKAGTASATVVYSDNKLSKITNPTKTVTIKYVNTIGATTSGGDTSKGYTLNGWYTATSGGSKVASNSTTPALQANVSGYTNASSQWTKTSGATLYAQWNPTTATLPRVTKGGYNCKWTTDNGASSVQSGGTWTFSSANERTFTAVCTAKTVKVTFKKNSSSASGTDNQTQTFTYGKSGQKFSPKGFSWTGHTQGKWAESATGTGVYSIESGVSDAWINSHSPSITLYATWSTNSYKLTYSCSGDSNCNGKTITRSYGQAWGANCTPSKVGYNFNGWSGVPATATGNVTATCNMSRKTYTLTIVDPYGGCNGKKIKKSHGDAWNVNCYPSVSVTSCHKYIGSSGCGTNATGNCTLTYVYESVTGWKLTNNKNPMSEQKWIFCDNGSWLGVRSNGTYANGEYRVPVDGPGSALGTYYIQDGYAWCKGWDNSSGHWFFYSNEDLDNNGSLDCRKYINEDRFINGHWYHFNGSGICDGPPGCTY